MTLALNNQKKKKSKFQADPRKRKRTVSYLIYYNIQIFSTMTKNLQAYRHTNKQENMIIHRKNKLTEVIHEEVQTWALLEKD